MSCARIITLVALAAILCGAFASVSSADNSFDCNPTKPNGNVPPGERSSPDFFGNGDLWTVLWPEGNVVFRPKGPGFILPDGSLKMKFPWWRRIPDKLTIHGRRLDSSARPLRVHIGKADRKDFVPSYLIFPTQGCWEITAKAGTSSLAFVTRVSRVGYRKRSGNHKTSSP
ncbi:MAG TPA: hypothetical protein VIG25_10915 [Pyrinomonadaceae bacterium]|jgi:hypothetical protein